MEPFAKSQDKNGLLIRNESPPPKEDKGVTVSVEYRYYAADMEVSSGLVPMIPAQCPKSQGQPEKFMFDI